MSTDFSASQCIFGLKFNALNMHISFPIAKNTSIVCYTIQAFQRQYENHMIHVFTTYMVDYVIALSYSKSFSDAPPLPNKF